MILSEIVTIEFSNDNDEIVKKIMQKGIVPLRWAVVDINNNEMKISVTYEN